MADLLTKAIGEQCFNRFFIDKTLDMDCVKSLAAECIGLGITAGSILLKLPQVFIIII